MKFQPKSDAEIANANLLQPGEYDYEVTEAHEKTSSKGNDMVEMKVRIFTDESERMLTDYLLEAMPAKLKHFCYSHGMGHHYENGTLHASDCAMLSGKCKVGIEKDRSGKYPDKNKIVDYLMPAAANVPAQRSSQTSQMPPTAPGGIDDSDVPF